MNRKQRRMAAKKARQTPIPAAPSTNIDPSTQIAELSATALRHHQAGQLAAAERLYRKIIAIDPHHVGSLHLLGVIAHQVGRNDVAVDLIRQAIALNDQIPAFHNNIGLALSALGHTEDAVVHLTRAVTLDRDFAEAHNNLGATLREQGRLDEAMAQFRHALALKPDYAEAYNNLGNALQAEGKLDEAVAQYRRALALKPDYVEAHNHLGNALQAEGKLDEAMAQYQRALALKPDYAEAHNNLGSALMEKGDLPHALRAIQRGIEIQESQYAKTLFVQCVSDLDFIPHGINLRENLIRALSEPWGRPIELAKVSASLLKLNGATSACINRAANAWPQRLPAEKIFSPTEFDEVCNDQLFRCLLESTRVCDIELERFLTVTRFTMLEVASAGTNSHQVTENALRFFCAMAQQCFINEYIFTHMDHEMEQARRLRALLIEALVSGTSVPEPWLVAVAAYFPLASLPIAELIVQRVWSAPVAALATRQVQEWQEERQLRTSIQRLTTIEDGVSFLVKQQYEENPYPRWMKAAPVDKSMTIDGYLRRQFPHASLRNIGKTSGAQILVAGCGTGQHSIGTAQRFPGAQVLAVDLSMISLCYAKRKTRELGLSNIEYAQADILQLESIGRTFDVIEAVGVLHHLADPFAGWRLLLSMLRPGGFMRIGLYSKLARQHIVAARGFIAQRGYRPSAENIRRCRQELLSFDDGTPLKRVTKSADFFSTSTCRDMLFHVQEHHLTLPEISAFLTENRLELLGFDIKSRVLQKFRRRFPDDKTMADLSLWHIFETENPAIFARMYQFWVQKT